MKLLLSMSCAVIALLLPGCGKQSLQPDLPAAPPRAVDARVPPAVPPAPHETTSSEDVARSTTADDSPRPDPPATRPESLEEVMEEPFDPMKGRKELAALPQEYYGKWRLTRSGGGFAGREDPAPSDGEMIVITKANTIETYKSGKLVRTNPFRISRGPSIFGNDNWLIYRGGIGFDVISLRGPSTLGISENHVECHSWSYERIP